MSFFELLLLVHIAGAIIGFGPVYAFAVLGPLAGKLGGQQALGLLKGTVAISKRLVVPVSAVTQPLSGILLITESGRDENFFEHEWLWISLLLYIVTFYLALFVQRPNGEKIVGLIENGEAGSEEFQTRIKKSRTLGPLITLSLTIITLLMITKPGSPEGFF